jgi:hypothetical protein
MLLIDRLHRVAMIEIEAAIYRLKTMGSGTVNVHKARKFGIAQTITSAIHEMMGRSLFAMKNCYEK